MRIRTLIGVGAALGIPVAASAQTPAGAAFVVHSGADTIAVERFTRGDESFRSDLELRAGVRIRMEARLGPDGTVPEIVTRVKRGPAAEVVARVTFAGDSAFVEIAGAPTQRFAPGANALPYVNLSTVLLEQIARRARAVGGSTVTVPMLDLSSGQAFTANVVVPAAGSMRITLPPGVEIELEVDESGRVRSASVPSQGAAMDRVDTVAPAAAPEPPDYSAAPGAPYRAVEVDIPTPEGHTLAGTLTLPGDVPRPVPAAILISGSGPQERDEAIPGIAGYRPFREIADALSRRGIAVLRYDDRGVGGSTGDHDAATSEDFAADAAAVLEYLRGRREIDADRLALVGHSEGGLIAPLVAASDERLRAIALLAGPSRTGREILGYQLRGAIGRNRDLSEAARDSALAGVDAQIESLGERPWVRYFLEHDPLSVARRVHTPVLILQGATDQQVTPEQAEELAAAFRAGGDPDVTLRVFPGINHLFLRDASGDPAGYAALPSHEVAPEVLDVLAGWLVDRLR